MTRILLADADSLVRTSLALLCKHKLGIDDVVEVKDGSQLTASISACAPDLLLIDWELPGLDVVQLHGQLIREGLCPALIVMSVHKHNEPWAIASGADAFLNKSAPGEYVLDVLQKFI